jgi:hypothetical protein
MKRYGYLWEGMIAFENLLRAAEAARRGKRFLPAAARFFFHLERELTRLHEELASKTYQPGPYRTFTIYEGKTRQISAAPFRDRGDRVSLPRRGRHRPARGTAPGDRSAPPKPP